MKTNRVLAAVMLVWGMPLMAAAEEAQPTPSCIQPFKPEAFNTQAEYDNFMSEVRDYKQCITDFVQQERAAAKLHQAAANAAAEEWNAYREKELK